MPGVHWNALMQPVDVAGKVWEGFDRGRKLREEHDLRKAIAAAQRGDQEALAVVMQLNPSVGMALEDQLYQRRERQRESDFRGATADMLLGGGQPPMGGAQPSMGRPAPGMNALASPPSNVPAFGGGSGAQAGAPRDPLAPLPETAPVGAERMGPSPAPARSPAYERAVRTDPTAFLTFEGKRLDVTAKDLENYRKINDTAMQLLGGVHDQPTYEAAKQRAAQLYSSYGMDASEFISGLPAEYSPDLVESLRLQGMDTSKQMAAIARENRLEWDIEDDLLDNERADRNTDSMIGYRQERLKDADLNRDRPRRGGSRSDGKPKSANALYADIMRRWTAGEKINGREQEFIRAYEARQKKSGGGRRLSRGRSFGGGRVATAVGPDGRRIVVRNGKWVDAQTGKPVQ